MSGEIVNWYPLTKTRNIRFTIRPSRLFKTTVCYKARRFRPFLRRRLSTERPPTLDFLARNPCLFLLFLLLG